MYIYKSRIGLMQIKYDQNTDQFLLIINNICYGSYRSAVAAADDVYCHATGCYQWDRLDGKLFDVPTDINEWAKLPDR